MIAIIKYNAGNINSVQNALTRLGYESIITDDKATILQAEKVILPGVGEASTAMQYLKNRGLDKVIQQVTQPLLGICLGLQLLCQHSEEGNTPCLGIFDTVVKKFPAEDKVPHVGWNNFDKIEQEQLMKGIQVEDDVYYVHSYYAVPNQQTIASCAYILPFGCVFRQHNFYATQFHPEKSAQVGEKILKNFLEL